MKVLYLGVYRDGTGWGQAAIDNILALDAAGVDVVPRPIKLNYFHATVPERILELEENSPINSDVVIQHILPSYMEYSGNFQQNVGMYCSETDNFTRSVWPEHINLLDKMIVPCKEMLTSAINSNVNIPMFRVNYAANTEKYTRPYEPIPIPEAENTFVFYTILEFSRRKHLSALLKAFHLEFAPSEPVNLLIKASKYGTSSEELRKGLIDFCESVKTGLKLYQHNSQYKAEILITTYTDEETVCRIHKTGDCFVLPSYGEAWNIPAFDAMAFGKTPIVSSCGGFLEYITNDTGWLVEGNYTNAFGVFDSLPELFTSDQLWFNVDIAKLRSAMREAYENFELKQNKSLAGEVSLHNFSYNKIGNQLLEALQT